MRKVYSMNEPPLPPSRPL